MKEGKMLLEKEKTQQLPKYKRIGEEGGQREGQG